MRARMIFCFACSRSTRSSATTPWGHYEENPDHYVTAQCVEAACWMAAGHLDFRSILRQGLSHIESTKNTTMRAGRNR